MHGLAFLCVALEFVLQVISSGTQSRAATPDLYGSRPGSRRHSRKSAGCVYLSGQCISKSKKHRDGCYPSSGGSKGCSCNVPCVWDDWEIEKEHKIRTNAQVPNQHRPVHVWRHSKRSCFKSTKRGHGICVLTTPRGHAIVNRFYLSIACLCRYTNFPSFSKLIKTRVIRTHKLISSRSPEHSQRPRAQSPGSGDGMYAGGYTPDSQSLQEEIGFVLNSCYKKSKPVLKSIWSNTHLIEYVHKWPYSSICMNTCMSSHTLATSLSGPLCL